MHIELTISDVGALIPQANRLGGGFNRRRGQQRVAGRGSGRGAGGIYLFYFVNETHISATYHLRFF